MANVMILQTLFGVLLLGVSTLAQSESSYGTCPTIRCARIGPPICACLNGDLQLFPTNCALSHHRCLTEKEWKVVKMVECAIDICPVDCDDDKDLTPVCASNGNKTKKFKNECEFRNYACKHYHTEWNRQLSCQ